MKYWKDFNFHFGCLLGRKKQIDNTIYTFDIETTSYLILDGNLIPGCDYLKLSKDNQSKAEFRSCMYIWQFSINNEVYYGRTWNELRSFLTRLNFYNPHKKYVYVHNLGFEFNYIKEVFNITKILARKKRKPIECEIEEFNIVLRCSYFLTNAKLELLPSLFKLPVEKQVGSLDYNKIRHYKTKLTDEELKYCEYDCLVVYEYIKKELETYKRIDKIPLTSTGHVRRELKERTNRDFIYKEKVRQAINDDPHIYNMLVKAFMGGYTHSCWAFTDTIVKNIDSYDFCSSYPYILVSFPFPSTEFKKVDIKRREDMYNCYAYLLRVSFKNIKSKYYNNFISVSKCDNLEGFKADNGRIIEASKLEMTLTDIDFYLILDTYNIEEYEILESYSSVYRYLPKKFIDFILEKYINKTSLKGVER